MTSARSLAPAARSAADARSPSLWLMPRSHGTKIMPVGQSPAMYFASCVAPETIRICGSPWRAAAAWISSQIRGSNSVGGEFSVSITSTAHPPACARHTAATSSPRRLRTVPSGCRKSMVKRTWPGTVFGEFGRTSKRPTVKRAVSVGRFEVRPNSPNTVPGQVLFTIDFRHPDGTVLSRLGDEVAAVCRAHAGGCAVDVIESLNSPPTEFDPRICELIQAAAARQGLPHMRIVSGATHDAKYMAGLCPTGMIFVPCERGISHNEGERASAADLAAGARLLAEVMLRLD